ncbi:putative cytochrome P450 oxidoreductase/alkane hydroxylase [Whalleya microplaca]|nr:putative cytochrome P450 oxidoreductase/alkane hydroxylase [Whalleya microplaca]
MDQYNFPYSAIAPIALGAVLCLATISTVMQRRHRLQTFAEFHGCQAPVYESAYPISITKAWELVQLYQARKILSHFSTLFGKLGDTYVSRVLWLDIIVTCDAENIKQVLQRGFADFDIGPLRRHLFLPVTPHGIFNLDGKEWKGARKMYRVQFTDTRSAVDLDMIEECFQLLLRRIPKDGTVVDLQSSFVTDILSTYAVGEPLGALSDNQSPQNRDTESAYRFVKDVIARFGQSGPASWLYDHTEFQKASTVIRKYTEHFVCQAVNDCHQDTGTGRLQDRKERSFVQNTAAEGYKFSEIRDQTISIYLAGVDSVSGLLSATCWYLSRSPRVFQTLREAVVGKYGYDPPPYEELGSVVYLRYVFNEAMRLMPAVPFNAKVANKDTWLPRGGGTDGKSHMLVRKGQIVAFWPWATHRKSEIFGDDPETFRPERWESIKGDVAGFVPFQPGPRVCPGQRIALAMASYIIIRLLQSFASMEMRDTRPWTENLGLSLASKNGVIVALLRQE